MGGDLGLETGSDLIGGYTARNAKRPGFKSSSDPKSEPLGKGG